MLPRDLVVDGIARQLGKAATSESANYRARRGRSPAEFVAKIGLVVEEANESEHWLDVLRETGLGGQTFVKLRKAA
jgi:four helix bundle protein